MTALRDALDLPLEGTRTVEANAGTGKTFTIAALYLRLLLERGLQPEEIAVATFTRAATAELSLRLREWLALAERALGQDEPTQPRAGDSGEMRMVRQILAQASGQFAASGDDNALQTLRERARAASLAIDTAQISTLHGFCFRVLSEFGFDTGSSLRQPELIEDLRALDLEIIRDFWRSGSGDLKTAVRLADTWGDPETMAKQVGDPRWEGRIVEVPQPDFAALDADFDAARRRIAAWGDVECTAFEAELQRCVSTPRTRTACVQACDVLRAWASGSSSKAAFDTFDASAAASICADKITKLVPKDVRPQGQVFDDITALSDAYAAIVAAHAARDKLRGAELLREARTVLEHERARRMAERGLMGHDQAVRTLETALFDGGAQRNLIRIQCRWKAALVDEFQDTDTAQWNVVRKLFGNTTLILVGDPKQAIYGFRGGDVFAWRKAIASAAGEPLNLTTSYRSGTRLCEAVNALFRAPRAFIEDGIDYHDVAASAASCKSVVLRDGTELPGLECWSFTAAELGQPDDSPAAKDRARPALERRTVQYLAALLGSATLRDKHGSEQRLQPGNIAVLVNSNREAASMQAALGEAGIPACSNLRASVYASEEADDLALLLEAVVDPADARRARAAWASRLIGQSAAAIAATLAGDTAAPQQDASEWASAVRRQGVLAWLHGRIAEAAPRLLEQPDGARRVSNYLQLAELLQEDQAAGCGVAELVTRFARRRAEAVGDSDADSARLRLDTDAKAVVVSTVHAAKGLEYDVVILPYAGFAKDPSKKPNGVALYWYHDDAGDSHVALGPATASVMKDRARDEALAEDVRKLYVAITRARALCVLPWGRIGQCQHGALFHLLHVAGRETPLALNDVECATALVQLQAQAPDAIGVVQWSALPVAERWQAPAAEPVATASRAFRRADVDRDWTVWSFSRLVRGSHNAAAETLPGAGDHDDTAMDGARLGGARFGSAVHQVFERTDFAAWRNGNGVPAEQRGLIERALADHGVAAAGAALPQAVDAVGAMVRDALTATLPSGARLADIAPDARRAEIEFHLALAPAASEKLFALLHAHGYQRHRSGIAAAHLAGLLTGKIDLTYRHDHRYWIVDWKTNRCPPYDAAALDAEIARHDYDLQWILYTLALHRWLGATLDGYDYDRDFGGVEYLFVRGMQDGGGVRADRPSRGLIDALDALFPVPRGVAA